MRRRNAQEGFSLIEMLVVMSVFLVVSGAVFGLLNIAQKRYRAEQQVLDIMQNARIGVDLLVLDINRAGYPPVNGYDAAAWGGVPGIPGNRIATPFFGLVGGAAAPGCIVDTAVPPVLSTCAIPNNFELIIETDLDPDNLVTPEQVEWVYYRLATPGSPPPPAAPGGGGVSRTLYRAVAPKVVGTDPTIAGNLVPFVENVLNDPGIPPGGPANPPLFTFVCDGGALTCTPNNIVEVGINLRVQAAVRDMGMEGRSIRQFQALTLQSTARKMNPGQ